MRRCLVVLASLLLLPFASRGEDRVLDWVKVTDKAGWRPHDSSGEVVYQVQLWLLGGWFDSFSAPPRDVWSSPDGKAWRLMTPEAPWKHSDLPMTVAFQGRLWILGGTEDYYFGDDSSLKNDIGSFADGKAWKREISQAPWSARAYHAALVHDGRIKVLGGGNYVPRYRTFNDIWSSSVGVHWERVAEHAPWAPRIWFSAVVYRERMWVLGGWSNHPAKNWGDVWYSRDGKEWAKLRSNVVWKARHEHSACVLHDKIWVAGGHTQPLSSEVWSLEVPRDWFRNPTCPAEPGALHWTSWESAC